MTHEKNPTHPNSNSLKNKPASFKDAFNGPISLKFLGIGENDTQTTG